MTAKRAEVTSVEALGTFRARLIVYRDEARLALDGVRDEIVRTRLWLQNDQREHWERERCRLEGVVGPEDRGAATDETRERLELVRRVLAQLPESR